MSVDKLRAAFEKAERHAQDLQAEKDALRDKLRDANEKAAAAQKEWNDAVATKALKERDDINESERQQIADRLGLDLS